MKTKNIALIAFTLFTFGFSQFISVKAQPQPQQGEKRAERLADEFQLQGEKRSQFIDLFKAYRNEMRQVARPMMPQQEAGRPELPQPVRGGKVGTGVAPDKCDMKFDKKDFDKKNLDKKNLDKKKDDKKGDKKKDCDKKGCDKKGCDKKPDMKQGQCPHHHSMPQLTDEEAQKKLDFYFKHQERQIEGMQKRLEVERRYSEQFSKILTPQQMLRLFHKPQQNGKQHQQMNLPQHHPHH